MNCALRLTGQIQLAAQAAIVASCVGGPAAQSGDTQGTTSGEPACEWLDPQDLSPVHAWFLQNPPYTTYCDAYATNPNWGTGLREQLRCAERDPRCLDSRSFLIAERFCDTIDPSAEAFWAVVSHTNVMLFNRITLTPSTTMVVVLDQLVQRDSSFRWVAGFQEIDPQRGTVSVGYDSGDGWTAEVRVGPDGVVISCQ